MNALLALIIAAVISIGASVGATNATPGDLLYPVKVNVNEKIRIALTSSEQSKAELEAKYAERRLEEASTIASSESLDQETRTSLEENFSDFADRAEARMKALAATDVTAAADLAENFQVALDAHGRILAEIEAKADNDTEKNQLEALRSKVESENNDVKKIESDIETVITSDVSANIRAAAEGKLTAAENKIAEVRNFIQLKEGQLGADATAQANVRLAAAEQKIIEGKASLQAQAYAEAFKSFSDAHSIAQEAKKSVELNLQFQTGIKVDLNNNEAESNVKVNENSNSNERENVNINERENKIDGENEVNINGNTNLNVNENVNSNINL